MPLHLPVLDTNRKIVRAISAGDVIVGGLFLILKAGKRRARSLDDGLHRILGPDLCPMVQTWYEMI